MEDSSLVVVHTGMGPAATSSCLQNLLAARPFPCSGLVSIGLCGGLRENLKNGEVLLYGECGLLEESGTVGRWLPASDSILDRLREGLRSCGYALQPVRGLTSLKIVTGSSDKLRMGKETGAAVVDMETSAVFELAHQKGLPCAGLRVVLDAAGEQLPELESMLDTEGRFQKGAARAILLKSPHLALRLRRREQRALRVLTQLSRALRHNYKSPDH